tara:strand:+ start:291 stop:803 length:513 start_codon:yes stop_codon:yes gene_type:complete
MKINLKKRGQEELVGFVLIVILVAVIFLVFLGIFFRQGNTSEQESTEVFQFLESLNEYTTDCAIGYVPDYSNVGELIQECHEARLCTNGKTACEALNETVRSALEVGWDIGEGKYRNGYEFGVVYESETLKENIMEVSGGNCSAGFTGSELTSAAGPDWTITSFLKVCFG